MNALEQVKHTLYRQKIQYLMGHAIGPNNLTVRITVSRGTRSELIRCATPYVPVRDPTEDQKETILS